MTRTIRGVSWFYSTSFVASQNPLSEGGNWRNGATNAQNWSDFRSTGGKAFGTQTGTNTNTAIGVTPSKYNDSSAVLNGPFTPDQYASAKVYSAPPNDAGYATEVELFLRGSSASGNLRGYEIEYSANLGNQYFDIVRWNGQVADFTPLLHIAGAMGYAASGDFLEAQIIGSTINAFKNGTLVASWSDTTWTNGSPGMGQYLHDTTATADVTTYGFTSYSAKSLFSRSNSASRSIAGSRSIVP